MSACGLSRLSSRSAGSKAARAWQKRPVQESCSGHMGRKLGEEGGAGVRGTLPGHAPHDLL